MERKMLRGICAILLCLTTYLAVTQGVRSLPNCREELIFYKRILSKRYFVKQTICEYVLVVEHAHTMTYQNQRVVPDCTLPNGSLLGECVACLIDDPNCAGTSRAISFDNVITGDGIFRELIAINGTMPGPKIEAPSGAMVVVHVKNNLINEPITVHWHGMFQFKTGFMDGVPHLTQCPINSGQVFTYRFKAEPSGTFFYHAHTGAHRTDGLVGALIVYPEHEITYTSSTSGSSFGRNFFSRFRNFQLARSVSVSEEEHVILLQDWFHEDTKNVFKIQNGGGGFYLENPFFPQGTNKFAVTFGPDKVALAGIPYVSGVINGRHRYTDPLFFQTTPVDNQVPYERYDVKRQNPPLRYRFRMISNSVQYAYRVFIDDHPLTVVASDGFEMEPVEVQSLLINPGERYDFLITADRPNAAYWLRAESLVTDPATNTPLKQQVLAILQYQNPSGPRVVTPDSQIQSIPEPCSSSNKCKVYNCPFGKFPPNRNFQCLNVGDSVKNPAAQGPHDNEPVPTPVRRTRQIFTNWHFLANGASVNGIAHVRPTAPPLTQPDTLPGSLTQCDASCDTEKNADGCRCTNKIDLEYKKAYQFVLVNHGSGGGNQGAPHPIHMHGHSFHVLKVAYADQDANGAFLKYNDDICCPCPDDETKCCTNLQSTDIANAGLTSSTGGRVPCNNPRWRNNQWNINPSAVAGLNLQDPLRKDTIIVPAGGYAVVRIEADNPGWWFFHCHVEIHALGGMALVLNEAQNLHKRVPPPPHFPKCMSFDWSAQEYIKALRRRIDGISFDGFIFGRGPTAPRLPSSSVPDADTKGLVEVDDNIPISRQGLRVPIEDENAPNPNDALAGENVNFSGFLQSYGRQGEALQAAG
ncbi:laccase-2 [Lingula anatina]|uniref:Laccase-2 n=1 Tax=Lingula anatina TaxID=7574 RepID=A0A1S3K3B6_LINAN|nr:laccase-2 [Lingula anatina]|eukprot:XP_013416914.1 laccase-2 [Lingula anatina]